MSRRGRSAVAGLARWTGLVSGLGSSAGWVLAWVVRPWGELGIATPAALLVTCIFAGLALAGTGAAARRVPAVLTLAGFFSVVPVGVYLLLAPGWLPLVGACDVGMLVSGVAWLVADGGIGGADEEAVPGEASGVEER